MRGVDVVVPCYKYGMYLRQSVESILGQAGVAVRVLILDDASPDNTPEVARELERADARVTYRRHATNQGATATFNEGLLDWATQEFSLLISADDLLTPHALRRAVDVLEAHPEVGFVYGPAVHFKTTPPEMPPAAFPEHGTGRVLSGPEYLEVACTTGVNPVWAPTAVVRTALQKELGGYRHDLALAHDMEMWFRFAARGPVGLVDQDQAFYRWHGQNMNLSFRGIRDLSQRRDAFAFLFEGYGAGLPGRERLEAAARRVLAEEAFWRGSKAFDRGDLALCEEYVAFAGQTCPALRSWRPWSLLRWKRRLGPRVCGVLRPLLSRLRGGPAAATPPALAG